MGVGVRGRAWEGVAVTALLLAINSVSLAVELHWIANSHLSHFTEVVVQHHVGLREHRACLAREVAQVQARTHDVHARRRR